MLKKRLLTEIFAFVLLLVFSGSVSFSQTAFWEKVSGLVAAKVNVLMVDPSGNLYAGTNGDGIYKSSDDGQTWLQINSGLSNKYIYSLVVDKTKGYLYAGSIGGGVFRSINNGISWLSMNNGIQNSNINSLVVNINSDVYAGTSGGGIFITTDFGENWSKVNTGLMSNYVYSLAVNSSGQVFAGTWSGMYKSLDNGANWLSINNGFPNTYVFSIAIDAQGYIYSGTSVEGILRSTNQGNSWLKVNQGLPGLEVRSIVINSLGHLYIAVRGVGVYKSSDNGTNWSSVSEGLTSTELRSLSIKNNGYLFAGTLGNGIFKSIVSTQISTAITDTASEVSDISAVLNGYVNPNGFETAIKFQYGTTTNYGNEVYASQGSVSGLNIQRVSGIITGLTPNTTYHYRLVSSNIAGSSYGSDQTFTTLEFPLYMVLNTSTMAFTAIQNGILPTAQNLSIARNGNSNLIWTAKDDADWLDINPTSGQNEGNIKVSVNTTSPDTGTLTAKITLTAPRTTNSPQIVNVTYRITGQPKVTVNTFNLKFDTVVLNNSKQLTLNILNSGMADLVISNLKIAGLDSSQFSFANSTSLPFSILPGNAINLRLNYNPKSTGNHLAYLQVHNNSNASPIIVSLAGVCVLSSEIALPETPKIIYPTNDLTGVTLNTTLLWNKSRNATSFGFQLSDNAAFTNIIFDFSTNDTSYYLMNLPFSTKYHWRVNSSNSRGTSEWSSVFSFTTSGNSAKMIIFSGDAQSLLINHTLEKPIVIKITDAAGYPVANAEVNFSFASVPTGSAGHLIFSQKVRTNDQGLASIYVKTGTKSGVYSIKAVLGDAAIQPLFITLNATAGAPVKLTLSLGQNQVGYVNSYLNQFIVQVVDEYVNPIPGIKIKFEIKDKPVNSFGYLLSVNNTITDNQGEAITELKLGNLEGKYSVSASIEGSIITPVTFYSLAVLPEYPEKFGIDTTSIRIPILPNISDFRGTDWRIVGFPGTNNKVVSELLEGIQGVDWQLYWDNGAANNYLVKYDGGSRFVDSVGKAFWLITRKGVRTNVSINAAPLNNKKEVEILLHSRWNLITNPFNLPIAWSEIQKYNKISNPIYAYENGWKMADALMPFTGYLFDRPDTISSIKIPYYLAYIGSKSALSEIVKGWKINILLQSGDYNDETAWLGQIPENGNANFNFRKPRAINGDMGIYFKKTANNSDIDLFTTDFRSENNEINIWEFEVLLEQNKKTRLLFSGLEKIPSNYSVFLVNEKKIKINLKADSIFYFMSDSKVSKFVLVTGDPLKVDDYLNAELTPRKYVLGKNYPNPFNPNTSIQVEIPVKCFANLSIFNMLGKEVRTLFNNSILEGIYNFDFDGKDKDGKLLPSGIYICQLKTNTGISIFNKMVLIK